MLKPFKRNVFRMQTIERFVRGDDAAFCQIPLTTSSSLLLSGINNDEDGLRNYRQLTSIKATSVSIVNTTPLIRLSPNKPESIYASTVTIVFN